MNKNLPPDTFSVISLKYLILIGLVSIILLAGCTTPPVTPPAQQTQPPAKVCHNETNQVTQVHEECGPVSYTIQVCGSRMLPYEAIALPLIHICSTDGPCSGGLLSNCTWCTKAMTRCMMTIHNLDKQSAGDWTVGANYTVTGGQFIKEPQTLTIGPNQTGVFDFNQFYNPGDPISSASCLIYVMSDPTIEDCHDETRTRNECVNITDIVPVTKTVCQ